MTDKCSSYNTGSVWEPVRSAKPSLGKWHPRQNLFGEMSVPRIVTDIFSSSLGTGTLSKTTFGKTAPPTKQHLFGEMMQHTNALTILYVAHMFPTSGCGGLGPARDGVSLCALRCPMLLKQKLWRSV